MALNETGLAEWEKNRSDAWALVKKHWNNPHVVDLATRFCNSSCILDDGKACEGCKPDDSYRMYAIIALDLK